jgi:hypothetical protein
VTKRERAAVVELLRCAAEIHRVGCDDVYGGIGVATNWLDVSFEIWECAKNEWERVADALGGLKGWTYSDVCLEAAARLEGSGK